MCKNVKSMVIYIKIVYAKIDIYIHPFIIKKIYNTYIYKKKFKTLSYIY